MTRLALLCLWLAVLIALLLRADTDDEPPTKVSTAPATVGKGAYPAIVIVPQPEREAVSA